MPICSSKAQKPTRIELPKKFWRYAQISITGKNMEAWIRAYSLGSHATCAGAILPPQLGHVPGPTSRQFSQKTMRHCIQVVPSHWSQPCLSASEKSTAAYPADCSLFRMLPIGLSSRPHFEHTTFLLVWLKVISYAFFSFVSY